ncbi:hypothetical protein L211DRAFT_338924 [Terfezia boudieri ATCC MYA-4762]|uniref:Uncharacterized protein n=1 Tax=Terfezia boudieri ATCC MYA-4762 TaxID=1051890 RepID=A0A3N4LHT5_9PEZI|nr:hypothetical protein L211DRAFT_338924 [Terfezia boudieri ATCC MYA-4762]
MHQPGYTFKMFKVVNFFRGTDQLPSLPTLNITPSGEDGTSAPPPTPVEGAISRGEEGEAQEVVEEIMAVWDTASTYSVEDGDFIRLGQRNAPKNDPFEAQYFCSSDLDNLIDRYHDIHELPRPCDVRFVHMLNYLGWHMPLNELVADSLKWALIMKIRASLENELMTKWGFHEIHHVSNSDNPGEYVVHAIYRGLMPENLPSYFFKNKYVCMYFGGWNAENLGICECDDLFTCTYNSEQDLGSAAEYETDAEHIKFETGGEVGSKSGNEFESGTIAEPRAQPDVESEVKPVIFSDLARGEGKNSRVTRQALNPVIQEPQQQEQQQTENQQEEEQYPGQPQRPQEQQEALQQPQQPRQLHKLSELFQIKQLEYISQLEVYQQRVRQQILKQKIMQHPALSPAETQAESLPQLPHQLPPQLAQTSIDTAPYLLPFPPPQSTTQWSAFASDTLYALEAREEAHRYRQQVQQLLANYTAKLGEELAASTIAPSTLTGYWPPTAIPGPTLPLPTPQVQQHQAISNKRYECPLNQASCGTMCDPSVTLGLLRDRPNIGNMDEYMEKRYGTRYADRRI